MLHQEDQDLRVYYRKMNHLTIGKVLEELKEVESPFLEVFKHGSLVVEMYQPDKVDLQSPHTRDEVYIIAAGSGAFVHNEVMKRVEKGDFLFVPAGDEHRFVDFSNDFSTWVLFYGPEGGE
ncbi:hypothetical protein GCM10007940_05810 [Portibacter lacus]|uniref:Cupin type-2 domain-containing protein n=2 Tax=Portibacter lacus TaxID=1099794 RepID=A0AA37SMY8_9BACT|nr:hypothetical protein GCM10007940_05810 [Portibacter lacus]